MTFELILHETLPDAEILPVCPKATVSFTTLYLTIYPCIIYPRRVVAGMVFTDGTRHTKSSIFTQVAIFFPMHVSRKSIIFPKMMEFCTTSNCIHVHIVLYHCLLGGGVALPDNTEYNVRGFFLPLRC